MAEEIRLVIADSPLTSARGTVAQRWLLRAFLLLLFWTPLPLGSNRPWAWGLMECWTFLLLAAWAVQRWRDKPREVSALRTHRLAIVLLGLGVLYPLWQIIPWSESLLTLFSPTTLLVRHLIGTPPLAGPISLDVHLTQVEWLKGMAYLGIFWLTLVLPTSRGALRQLTWVLLGSGLVQVGMNLLTLDTDPTHDVHGSFVNHNHLAGFLELVLPVGIGLLRSQYLAVKATGERWQDHFYRRISCISGPQGVLFGVCISMVITLFMTQSRGGNGSLFLALFLVSLLSRILTPRKKLLSSPSKTTFFILAVSILVGSSVGLEQLVGRYLETHVEQEDRLTTASTARKMVADYPWFGSGSGTFAFVYPRYQSASFAPVLLDHAHNDHLEFLTERGIIGYGLLVAGVLACWWQTARAYGTRRDPLASALLYASLVATLSLVIHGLTDFNFQIPVNALYFMVLLALGLRGTQVASAQQHARVQHHTR